jgi:hypothetical protein
MAFSRVTGNSESDASDDDEDSSDSSDEASSKEEKEEEVKSKANNNNNSNNNNNNKANTTKKTKKEKQHQSYVKSVKLQERVRLSTVDNFQGEEADVVIISTVRCNNGGHTGFLKISNRVNVMMSRAKHGMFVFGSSQTVRADKKATVFGLMLDIFEEKEAMGDYLPLFCKKHNRISKFYYEQVHRRTKRATQPSDLRFILIFLFFVVFLSVQAKTGDDFQRLSPDGGCDEPCGVRMPCGHSCQKRCHPGNLFLNLANSTTS